MGEAGSPGRAKSAPRAVASAAQGATRAHPAIVKLGGSLAVSPHLKDWLEAIAAEAGAVVVVPGGGPFADAVRAAQAVMGFDDAAAHAMALAAMAAFGRALESLAPRLEVALSRAAIRRALRAGAVPVWAPETMALAARLPETWDLTSDSLAAWLAGELEATQLVLVKHGRFPGDRLAADDLAERGVVDRLFPQYLRSCPARASLAAPDDSARLGQGLRRAVFPEIVA
jgi:dihydroneopterin aldolase